MANLPEIVEYNAALVLQLHEETANLKELLKQSEVKIEEYAQEAHGLRSQVNLLTVMQHDYQAEIDSLQLDRKRKEASYEAALQRLKDEHAENILELQKKVELLEAHLADQQSSYATELSELKETGIEKHNFEASSIIDSLRAELQEAHNDQADCRKAHQQTQELYQLVMKEKTDLQFELQNVKDILEITQEKLNIAKDDLNEQTDALEELRATLTETQNELASFKLQPADAQTRGNSLFAEVEDRRKAMVKRVIDLNAKYTQMKNDYSAKCDEISKLKAEKFKMCQIWKEETEKQEEAEVWLADNTQIRMKELQDTIAHLKSVEKPIFIEGDTKILKYADHCVQESRKEIQKLRDEMEWRSAQRLNEAEALYAVRCESKSLRSRVFLLEAEVEHLTERLEEANKTSIPPPEKQLDMNVGGFACGKRSSASSDCLRNDIPSTASLSSKSLNIPSVKNEVQSSAIVNAQICQDSAVQFVTKDLDQNPVTEFSNDSVSLGMKSIKTSSSSELYCGSQSDLPVFKVPEHPLGGIQLAENPSVKFEEGIVVESKTEESMPSTSAKISDIGGLKSLKSSEIMSETDFNTFSTSNCESTESSHLEVSTKEAEKCKGNPCKIGVRRNNSPVLSTMKSVGVDVRLTVENAFSTSGGDFQQKPILTNILSKSCLSNIGNVKPNRKVCFNVREENKSACQASSDKDNIKTENALKKRSVKTFPSFSYKTNFIVSKESESP